MVDAAAEAGVEVREGFVVEEVLAENGRVVGIKGHSKDGVAVAEHAGVVVGADGRNSIVAEAMKPEKYHERPPLLAPYYMYFSDLPMHGRFETYIRPNRGFAAVPTHDGLTVVVAGWPYAEFGPNKRDIEGNYFGMFELAPEFAERVRGARRETRIMGAPTPNYYQRPYGRSWALVGDAGYLKDPITAQGILDSFRDAEACASALHELFAGIARTTTRWVSINVHETTACSPSTTSHASSRRSRHRHRKCSGCRSHRRQCAGDERFCTNECGDDLASTIFCAAERRVDSRRCRG